MSSKYYVYAIVAGQQRSISGQGIEGAPLIAVSEGSLVAIGSMVNTEHVRPVPELLFAHERVTERLCREYKAIPVRFGTVLADEASVKHALRSRSALLLHDLERLGDKVEFGITALWRDANHNSGVAGAYTHPISEEGKGPGTHYLQQRIESNAATRRQKENAMTLFQDISHHLREIIIERQVVLLPMPRVALRATYLLEGALAETFQQQWEQYRTAYQAFRFLLSGPWPPYSFVTKEDANIYNTNTERLADATVSIS